MIIIAADPEGVEENKYKEGGGSERKKGNLEFFWESQIKASREPISKARKSQKPKIKSFEWSFKRATEVKMNERGQEKDRNLGKAGKRGEGGKGGVGVGGGGGSLREIF